MFWRKSTTLREESGMRSKKWQLHHWDLNEASDSAQRIRGGAVGQRKQRWGVERSGTGGQRRAWSDHSLGRVQAAVKRYVYILKDHSSVSMRERRCEQETRGRIKPGSCERTMAPCGSGNSGLQRCAGVSLWNLCTCHLMWQRDFGGMGTGGHWWNQSKDRPRKPSCQGWGRGAAEDKNQSQLRREDVDPSGSDPSSSAYKVEYKPGKWHHLPKISSFNWKMKLIVPRLYGCFESKRRALDTVPGRCWALSWILSSGIPTEVAECGG